MEKIIEKHIMSSIYRGRCTFSELLIHDLLPNRCTDFNNANYWRNLAKEVSFQFKSPVPLNYLLLYASSGIPQYL